MRITWINFSVGIWLTQRSHRWLSSRCVERLQVLICELEAPKEDELLIQISGLKQVNNCYHLQRRNSSVVCRLPMPWTAGWRSIMNRSKLCSNTGVKSRATMMWNNSASRWFGWLFLICDWYLSQDSVMWSLLILLSADQHVSVVFFSSLLYILFYLSIINYLKKAESKSWSRIMSTEERENCSLYLSSSNCICIWSYQVMPFFSTEHDKRNCLPRDRSYTSLSCLLACSNKHSDHPCWCVQLELINTHGRCSFVCRNQGRLHQLAHEKKESQSSGSISVNWLDWFVYLEEDWD